MSSRCGPPNKNPATTLPPALAATVRQVRLFASRRSQLLEPAVFVHVKPASSISTTGITHSNSSCATLHQRIRLQSLDQFFTQRQQDCGVARGIFQLRFRQLKVPVAQSFRLVDCFVEIATRDRFESVTFFDIARADELARQQRIEQPAEIDAEIVLDELCVELCVVRDLDRARRFEQTANGVSASLFAESPLAK